MIGHPKPVTYRNESLRALINTLGARRELECVDCGARDGTVCAAHANTGKGTGLKAGDETSCALCYRCHSHLDQPGQDAMAKDDRRAYEREMNLRTLRILLMRGLLHVSSY
jgi:hypothetical protein